MLVADFEGNLKVSAEEGADVNLFDAPFAAPELPVEEEVQQPVEATNEWNFDQPVATQTPGPEPEVISEPVVQLNPEIQEINDFANSSAALASEGTLLYDLKIEGLDDNETKGMVKEFIDDVRLKLDVKKIMNTVKNGTLEIKNLNPVKASIIVSRIRDLPVQISWTQTSVFNTATTPQPVRTENEKS